MYSAIDAASAIVDFAKGNIEHGVVNSPPSRGAGRLLVCSPSPLQGCDWTPTGQRSCSLIEKSAHTPQRQLYSKPPKCSVEDVKEIDPVHFDNEVRVQPASKLLESLSHGSSWHQLPEERGRLRRTQLLTRQPSLQLSTRGCESLGRNTYSVCRQSTLSHHCLYLFGKVENKSVHLLEFLIQKPIRAGTRFWKGLQSWSLGRWIV